MKDLNKIIEKAYQLFSGNKMGETLDACTFCCMTEEEARELRFTPLKEISVELLKEYQDSAKPEKLNLSELKYFAPRYLELVKDFNFPSFQELLSFTRFGYIKDEEWTPEERKFLDEYAQALFYNYMHSIDLVYELLIVDLLLLFHKGNFKVNDLLDQWTQFTSAESLYAFSNLLEGLAFSNSGVIKVNDAFSDELFDEKINTWLSSANLKNHFRNRIEEMIMNPQEPFDEEELEQLSWKYEMLN